MTRRRLHADRRAQGGTARAPGEAPATGRPARILELQRTAGNAAVATLLGAGPTVQRKDDKDLLKLVQGGSDKTKRNKAIREILEGLKWDGWEFPNVEKSQGDGCTGANTISKARHFPVAGGTDQLAMHVNFMISVTGMDRPRAKKPGYVNLEPTLLHVTARAKKVQYTCDGGAASIVTAGSSIHCGPNNDWDWSKANVDELALKLGVDKGGVQSAMAAAGYQDGKTYMDGAKTGLKAAMEAQAKVNYPTLTPQVIAGDGTW